jgi:cytochrome c551/c552
MNKYLYVIVIVAAGLWVWLLQGCDAGVKNGQPGQKENATGSSQSVLTKEDSIMATGETLFNRNCTSCHTLDEKVVGPPLRNITAKHDEKWLVDFIRDSQKMIRAGDKEAVKIYDEYNGSIMTSFSNLSDDEIRAILNYLKDPGPLPAKEGEVVAN